MAAISGAQLLARMADVLKVAEADLPATWGTLAVVAAPLAWADITQTLTVKGYTPTQIADCDYAVDWNYSQGMFRLGAMGGGYGDYGREWFEQFDLREMLKDFGVIVIDGVATPPSGSDVGGIVYGTSSAISDAKQNYDRMYGVRVRWRR